MEVYCIYCKPAVKFHNKDDLVAHLQYSHPGKLEEIQDKELAAYAKAFIDNMLNKKEEDQA